MLTQVLKIKFKILLLNIQMTCQCCFNLVREHEASYLVVALKNDMLFLVMSSLGYFISTGFLCGIYLLLLQWGGECFTL